MTIKCALTTSLGRSLNMRSYLCDHRRAEGEVGHEMAIHDVDVDPRGVEFHEVGACISKGGEVGTED